MRARLDPVTLEVIRNALPAIANEMAVDLQRTSYTMMIYEVRDFCTALVDVDGELVSQNDGGVSHFVADLGVVIADAPPPQIKARVASKRVSFSATPPLTDALLGALPARVLERDGARVRLLSGEPERLLQMLFEQGVRVHELEVVGADLEEAFVSLTSGRQAAS